MSDFYGIANSVMTVKELLNRKYFRLWMMLAGLGISLAGFTEIVEDAFPDFIHLEKEWKIFDSSISSLVTQLRSPVLTQAMTDITALGSVSVMLTLFIVLASVLASYKDYEGLSYLTVIIAGSGIWPNLLKPFFGRLRPDEANRLATVSDLSFPSGHSFGAAAIYLALAYYVRRYAKDWKQELFFYALAMGIILMVGVSRIYLGVHYPTDVLGGLLAGAAWTLLISSAFEY